MKVCKCGCELPDDYKYKKCDKCRKKSSDNFKKIAIGTLTVLGTVASLAITVASQGKIDPQNK